MSRPDLSKDVPSPIDLRNPADARQWVEDTLVRRPWRPAFFAAFVDALNDKFRQPFDLLELGSGPGHLAKAILEHSHVRSYIAFDFSDAMHALAEEHLGSLSSMVQFVTGDFRGDWAAEYTGVDAIVTMQALHEVRHKRHQPVLLRKVHEALRSGGLFLYCDHYSEPRSDKHPDLYFDRDEQSHVLLEAGFSRIRPLIDKGGMTLYACQRG